MSLDAIRRLRQDGLKPAAVFVVIGEKTPSLDDEMHVHIRLTDNPRTMDWRPLVSLLVALASLHVVPKLTLAVLEELEAVGARLFGAADPTGYYPLLENATDEHARLLRRVWEDLCRS